MNGLCKCKEICRPAANANQRAERAARKAARHDLTPLCFDAKGTLLISSSDGACLRAFLIDGGDNETVGRRANMSSKQASLHLKRIQDAFGFTSRAELAVALLRSTVTARVASSSSGETPSDLARSQEGA